MNPPVITAPSSNPHSAKVLSSSTSHIFINLWRGAILITLIAIAIQLRLNNEVRVRSGYVSVDNSYSTLRVTLENEPRVWVQNEALKIAGDRPLDVSVRNNPVVQIEEPLAVYVKGGFVTTDGTVKAYVTNMPLNFR